MPFVTSIITDMGAVTPSDTVDILGVSTQQNKSPSVQVRGLHNNGAAGAQVPILLRNGHAVTIQLNAGDFIEISVKRVKATGLTGGASLLWFT
jgi:translation elongation factor EF-Tu-like GTPase